MWSKLSLVTLTWKSNEMTQQEESHFVQDITAIIGGPKYKNQRYWSCTFWEKGHKTVTDLMKG